MAATANQVGLEIDQIVERCVPAFEDATIPAVLRHDGPRLVDMSHRFAVQAFAPFAKYSDVLLRKRNKYEAIGRRDARANRSAFRLRKRSDSVQTIAVLGANGVYARWLLPRLVADGHNVRALVRRPEAAGVARACGADIRAADIFDEASLIAGLKGCEIGINLATSLPGPSGRGSYEANDRVRREGRRSGSRPAARPA